MIDWKHYVLKWNTIKKIFDSYLTKVFIIFSILSIILSISVINSLNSKGLLFLSISTIIFIIAYIMYIIFVPEIIKNFDIYSYQEYLVERERKETLSSITEFKFIEQIPLLSLYIYKDKTYKFSQFTNLDNFRSNNSDWLFQLSCLKYAYINSLYFWLRFCLTFLLIVFIIIFYYTALERILCYIFKGVL